MGEGTREEFEDYMRTIGDRWGGGGSVSITAAESGRRPTARSSGAARLGVQAMTPGARQVFMRMAFDIDVRHVVSAVRVPTLILHSVGDKICQVENARFLARQIPGARYVELPGDDHVPWAGTSTRCSRRSGSS